MLIRSVLVALSFAALAACSTLSSTDQKTGIASAEPPKPSINLVLMYKLKPGVTPADFESWVKTTDYPGMRGLARVADFRTHRAEKLLMGEGAPSVQYIETFSIPDLDGFVKEDMGGVTVQGVMGQFMGFAEAPQFIVVSEVK